MKTGMLAFAAVLSLPALAAGQTQDSRLVWDRDAFEEYTGTVVKRWTAWKEGTGSFEWNRIPGETGWGQEVRKSGVHIGIYRDNRGFLAGKAYRLKFRANWISGTGTVTCYAGIHPSGGTAFPGVSWGPGVSLVKNQWTDVVYPFTASGWSGTVFLRADLTGVVDGGVVFDNVTLELLTAVPPEPWMTSGAPPVQPRTLYGMHDPGAEHLFNQKGRKGWVVHAIAIGDDSTNTTGQRFPEWVDGHGVVGRISYGFGHTLPHPSRFSQFAQRCANFAMNSTGCGIWSIGNEPGLESAGGVPITPSIYRDAYVQCRNAIKAVRPDALVITAGMVQGDLDFFEQAMKLLEGQCDGIAIHSYTNANFWHEANFELYQGMMGRVPASMRGLPVYMTEAGSGAAGPYPDQNTGFVDHLFRNVHEWNATPGNQQIRSVNFYRWLNSDQWGIETKSGMIADFLAALDSEYVWSPANAPAPAPAPAPPPPAGSGEAFETMPAWDSSHDASWGSAAAWSIAAGGASGNFLEASRSGAGSSAKVKVFAVPSNSTVEVSVWMRCPSGSGYWMEAACRPGRHSASDFDANPGAWALVRKFDSFGGQNGNGNTWTRYAATVSTGAATELSVGFKLGSSPGAGPTVGWDTLAIAATGTAPPPPAAGSGEDFETMPAWTSSHDASWGSAALWSIVPGGQSGSFLQASRSGAGSSAKVRVYAVPANTTIELSVYMKCPASSLGYWMECAYRLGSHAAQDFDSNPGAWVMVKKFDSFGGQNGNGDAWTRTAATFSTGASTELSVGFKLGSTPGGALTVGWDTLRGTGPSGQVLSASAAPSAGASGGDGTGSCGALGLEAWLALVLARRLRRRRSAG